MERKHRSLPSFSLYYYVVLGTTASLLAGCLTPNSEIKKNASALRQDEILAAAENALSNQAVPLPGGARAVKIIMAANPMTGSFDLPSVANPPVNPAAVPSGTSSGAGNGWGAVRLFNADGSLLPDWPAWFKRFEIGLSGTNNPSAPQSLCAGFAPASEATGALCNYDRLGATASVQCGGPSGYYRVSERHCGGSAAAGNGGPNDGIYLRAEFSRTAADLAPYENIMVVVEYQASSFTAGPIDPSNCFRGGTFSPSDPSCSDHAWQIYLKHSGAEVVQPFLMLVPPSFGHVGMRGANTGGGAVATKQFIVPLASDAGLTFLQLSRINGRPASGDFLTACDAGGFGSPLCSGMIFRSVTFFRI